MVSQNWSYQSNLCICWGLGKNKIYISVRFKNIDFVWAVNLQNCTTHHTIKQMFIQYKMTLSSSFIWVYSIFWHKLQRLNSARRYYALVYEAGLKNSNPPKVVYHYNCCWNKQTQKARNMNSVTWNAPWNFKMLVLTLEFHQSMSVSNCGLEGLCIHQGFSVKEEKYALKDSFILWI